MSGPSPVGRRPGRQWLLVVLVSVAVLLAGGITAVVLLTRPGGSQAGGSTSTQPPTPSTSAPASPTTPTQPATTSPTQPSTTPTTTPTTTPPAAFPYQPLYPFGSLAEVTAWQESFRSGGHQPWHLNADLTALSFTQGYLGYTNVDKVVGIVATARDDMVSVGFDNPNGQPVVAATLHLVRFGTGSDAPWEVVGTHDTTLTLTKPAYGTLVRSPVTVGGLVTGVDENLRVQVRELDRDGAIGQSAGVPAGGDRTPWTTKVSFTAVHHGALTIAVATGGHIAQVERFAITGVRW